jgi:hypothetical protein
MVSIAVLVGEDDISADFLISLFGPNKYKGKITIPGFPEINGSWNSYFMQLNLRFNPSNFTRDLGFEICPMSLLEVVVDKVIRAVFAYVDSQSVPPYEDLAKLEPRINRQTGEFALPPAKWQDTVVISSLDVTRDFSTTDKRFSMEQMSALHPKGYRTVVHYRKDGDLETITHTSGRKSPKFKIYNKSKERKAKIKSGARHLREFQEPTFRFEVHVPRTYLVKKFKIDTLTSLSESKFLAIANELWNTSNFSMPLVWAGQKTQELIDSSEYSEEVCEFVGAFEALQHKVVLKTQLHFNPDFLHNLEIVGIDWNKSIFDQGKPYAFWNFETGFLEII